MACCGADRGEGAGRGRTERAAPRRPPAVTRRNVLRGAAAGGLAWATGSARLGTVAAWQEPAAVTTLGLTAELGDRPTRSLPYRRLVGAPGWPLVVRAELATPSPARASRRRALVAFAHLTDIHVVDAASPGHPAFIRQYQGGFAGADFTNGFRPQETLTAHVVDAMVRRLNGIAAGPLSGRAFDFAISTGDNADGRGTHELETLVTAFNGGTLRFDAAGGPYVGIQDDSTDVPAAVYDAFWHPEPAPAAFADDRWKRAIGYPTLPGFLAAVARPVRSPGLEMPWYGGFGNHDIVLMGVLPDGSGPARLLEALAPGDRLPLAIPAGMDVPAFLQAVEAAGEAEIAALIERMQRRPVPAAASRRSFTRQEFVRLHLDQMGRFGPDGHGFSQENLENDTASYRFEPAPGIVGLMLDSTNPNGGPDGSLDPEQVAWLEEQLIGAHGRYFDPSGRRLETRHEDRLVVLFSHHNSRTFDNLTPPPGETTSARMGAAAFERMLQRFPNVILWVNGHTHTNRVWAHPDPTGRTKGFWEVNTAAHIDYPQEARTVEIFDNGDGTLSIVGVMVDHSDAADVVAGPPYGLENLAALALELAANDPALDLPFRLGGPIDRNVELVLERPF